MDWRDGSLLCRVPLAPQRLRMGKPFRDRSSVTTCLILAFVSLRCGSDAPDARVNPSVFAVFSQSQTVINQLGVPQPLPLTVGSTASPALVRSSNVEVVEIDPMGRMVGRKAGRAVLYGSQSSQLSVEVVPLKALRFAPASVTLRPGSRATIELIDSDGRKVDLDQVDLLLSDPTVVTILKGSIEGRYPGNASITARFGGAEATASVVVRGDHAAVLLSPPEIEVRPNQVFQFQGGRTESTWYTQDASMVRSLGSGVFEALRVGTTRACSNQLGAISCATVRVAR